MQRLINVVAVALVASGCFQATIDTGLPPSHKKVEKHWASGWIGGLVPPSHVETVEKCPDGVARVETKLSFLNQVVSAVTFGIYTPMYIEVTCADTSRLADEDRASALETQSEASIDEKQEALRQAARRSREIGAAVLVVF